MRVSLHAPFAPQIQAQVERDLVVAAAAGVQLGAGRARDLGDAAFDRGVDVFVGRRERERARRELLLDPSERGGDDLPLLLVEQPDALEHVHVRARASEVVDREATVVREADGEREQLVGRTLTEPTRPQRLPGRLAGFRSAGLRLAHAEPGPWRRDHVWAERPHSRTNPSESWWRNASSASYVARSWS